ncbi:MAG: hypothetical protein AAGI09_12560 [Pseudomonadota bacterium]
MANDFQWLLAMHETASRFGDGLKPELEALLRSDLAAHGAEVTPLPRPQISSGPAHQPASADRLEEAGIPSIAPGTSLRDALVHARSESASATSRRTPRSTGR